jgi:hypothetical protein
MLSLILQAKLIIKDHHENINNFQINKNINKITLAKQTTSIRLANPLENAFFIGQTSSYLIFLQQSSILHIYSREFPY